jgi:hypothetical protein
LVSNQKVCGRRPMETFAKLFAHFLVFVVSDHATSSGATDLGIPGMGRRLCP